MRPKGDYRRLEAGHDKACVEASNWDAAHERHASRILRHCRQGHYQRILERLPYWEVTPPQIDWDERKRTIAAILAKSPINNDFGVAGEAV